MYDCGPVRRTKFKFQIWSVSLGVTVCIALPAGPNSLYRSCVLLRLGVLRAPPLSLSFSPTSSPYIRPFPASSPFIRPSIIFLLASPPALSEEGKDRARSSIFRGVQVRKRTVQHRRATGEKGCELFDDSPDPSVLPAENDRAGQTVEPPDEHGGTRGPVVDRVDRASMKNAAKF